MLPENVLSENKLLESLIAGAAAMEKELDEIIAAMQKEIDELERKNEKR